MTVQDCLREHFPRFMARFETELEEVKPPLTTDEISQLETRLGLILPVSYKIFLRCTRGFQLFSPVVNFLAGFPRFPSDNTPHRLYFANYFKEADGDQVFFDVSQGLQDGEYPVHYYCHEDRPPTTWHLADSFAEWLEGLSG